MEGSGWRDWGIPLTQGGRIRRGPCTAHSLLVFPSQAMLLNGEESPSNFRGHRTRRPQKAQRGSRHGDAKGTTPPHHGRVDSVLEQDVLGCRPPPRLREPATKKMANYNKPGCHWNHSPGLNYDGVACQSAIKGGERKPSHSRYSTNRFDITRESPMARQLPTRRTESVRGTSHELYQMPEVSDITHV